MEVERNVLDNVACACYNRRYTALPQSAETDRSMAHACMLEQRRE